MIHLSYNGELYSYDNKTTTTVSAVTNIPVVIHPYVNIEGAKLYYKQDDVDGIVDISDNTANIPGAYLVTGDLQVALKLASDEMSNYFTIGVTVISSSGDIMDDDIRFTMDNKKRLILVPGYQTLLAIQFDNQSEIVTFKLPRYQEGVDLSTKVPYVNYRRPQVKDLGKALCTIEKTTEDSIYITWMVDATATQYDGVIQFQVEFADSEGYRWQSQIGEIPILASLYNTGLEPYTPDILEQYLGMMQEYSQQAAASAQEAREIEQSMAGQGLTEDLKQALLALARKVVYIDDGGLTYYGWLYDALYPPINLDSISALFQPGTTVINDSMSLDDLKQYLTVTAVYTDESTEELSDSDYSLSGSMTEGNQTITVSYGGKTTTFNVTVVSWVSFISAVFTQGSATIYDTDSLDTLKQYLVVTATYADSTTATVTDYTLSGTLTEGTSTITVSYGGKTDTFNVVVTFNETPGPNLADFESRLHVPSNSKIRASFDSNDNLICVCNNSPAYATIAFYNETPYLTSILENGKRYKIHFSFVTTTGSGSHVMPSLRKSNNTQAISETELGVTWAANSGTFDGVWTQTSDICKLNIFLSDNTASSNSYTVVISDLWIKEVVSSET